MEDMEIEIHLLGSDFGVGLLCAALVIDQCEEWEKR